MDIENNQAVLRRHVAGTLILTTLLIVGLFAVWYLDQGSQTVSSPIVEFYRWLL